jgi:hypothetical protein
MNDFNDYIKINELMKAFESKFVSWVPSGFLFLTYKKSIQGKKQMLIVNNHKLKERIENEKSKIPHDFLHFETYKNREMLFSRFEKQKRRNIG